MDTEKLLALKKELDALDKADAVVQTEKTKIADLEAKIQKLEAAPVTKEVITGSGVEVGSPGLYKGFYFRKQFTDDPMMAPSDPAVRDRVVKEVLDLIMETSGALRDSISSKLKAIDSSYIRQTL